MRKYLEHGLFSDKSMLPENCTGHSLSKAQEGGVIALIKDGRLIKLTRYSQLVTSATAGAVFK